MTISTTNKFISNPLDTLFSTRIRLTSEEQEKLRAAHREFRKRFASAPQAPVLAGSAVTVTTTMGTPTNAYAGTGLSDLVVADLIGTRDTIALPVMLEIQKLLGVEIVTKKRLQDRFKNYLEYLSID